MWQSIRLFVTDAAALGTMAAAKIRLLGSFKAEVALDLPVVGRISVRAHESDVDVVRQILRDRQYEIAGKRAGESLRSRYEKARLSDLHRPVIIDLGANIGVSSIWFTVAWPDATVIAVEPDEANFELLARNTAAWPNIMPIKAAIGAEPGYARVQREGLGWAATTERSSEGCLIVTVAELLERLPGSHLLLVKVDIEGFESDLFASNTEWIDSAQAIIVEPHDWLFPGAKTSRAFQRAFAARDFSLEIMGENLIYFRDVQ